jgi:hypothetical protein
VRLRGRLFARGDNLAGAIYGTILVMSVIAAADFREDMWTSLVIVIVTAAVFWLAHVYAHALAVSLDEGETISVASVRRVARHEWPLLQAALLPSFVLFLGAIGLFGTRLTYRLALGVGLAALVSWGIVFARKQQLSRRATVAVVVVNAAFGLFLVALKEIVAH